MGEPGVVLLIQYLSQEQSVGSILHWSIWRKDWTRKCQCIELSAVIL